MENGTLILSFNAPGRILESVTYRNIIVKIRLEVPCFGHRTKKETVRIRFP